MRSTEVELFQSVVNKDMVNLKKLINDGADVNVTTQQGRSLLMAAVLNGHLSMVEYLLQKGALVNAQTLKKDTALTFACKKKSLELIKILLENGAIISDELINNYLIEHLLIIAVQSNNLNLAQLMLSQGVDVNLKSKNKSTLLHEAVLANNLEMVKLLIDNGISLDEQNEEGKTPLWLAINCNHRKIFNLLLSQKPNLELSDFENKMTMLGVAAYNDRLKMVQKLIAQGAIINPIYKSNPLALAAKGGSSQIASKLIKSNADLNFEDSNKDTCLHLAASNGHSDLINLLLEHKANVNAINKEQLSPLLIAIQEGHTSIVKILLANNADINQVDANHNSALHSACEAGYIDIVDLLLEAGLNVNAVNNKGETPLHLACANDYPEIESLLIKKGADIDLEDNKGNFALQKAVYFGHIKSVLLLLNNKGFTLDQKIKSLFNLAIQEGHTEIVELLINRVFNIKAVQDQNNPLFYDMVESFYLAIEKGRSSIVNLFIKKGMDVQRVNSKGKSALLVALEGNSVNVAKLIIAAKAALFPVVCYAVKNNNSLILNHLEALIQSDPGLLMKSFLSISEGKVSENQFVKEKWLNLREACFNRLVPSNHISSAITDGMQRLSLNEDLANLSKLRQHTDYLEARTQKIDQPIYIGSQHVNPHHLVSLTEKQMLDYYKNRPSYQYCVLNPEARGDIWNYEKNQAFILGGIEAKRTFILVTPRLNYAGDHLTNSIDELLWLKDNGYSFVLNKDTIKCIPPLELKESIIRNYNRGKGAYPKETIIKAKNKLFNFSTQEIQSVNRGKDAVKSPIVPFYTKFDETRQRRNNYDSNVKKMFCR